MTAQPGLPAPHIAIFDSGIGGLSVLRALQHHMPQARLTCIADARFTPWGDRPAAWVVARCLQLSDWLLANGAGLVLVACNTGTTQAISALRARWPGTPFVGVEPGIKPAVAASRNGRVAVMATSGTLHSPRLAKLVAQHAGGTTLLRLPCPGLVEAIENASPGDGVLPALLNHIAAELRAARVDTVALGCTHYPLVAEALQARLGPAVRLVDTADAVARQVLRLVGPTPGCGATAAAWPLPRLLSTGDAARLQQAARRWLRPDALAETLALPDPDLMPNPS